MIRHALFLICIFIQAALFSEPQQSIAIFTYANERMGPWDADSVLNGIPGSEEAVIYVSKHLVDLGYRVTVFGSPKENSPHSKLGANPRFVNLDYNDGEKYSVAIAWRMPWAAKDLKLRASKVFLWPHDTWHLPLTAEQIEGFDGVFWISHWQREQWASINPLFAKFTTISGNGINTADYRESQERQNPYACIYGSNYTRGLQQLLDIWPEVKEQFPKATLDIYYGWQSWGQMTEAQEIAMKNQVTKLKALDVQEHGQVGHEELTQAFEKASFWTYPCSVPEVFCITALRAQYAGAVPVIIEGSALKETVRYGYRCFDQKDYRKTLLSAMQKAEEITTAKRNEMRDFIDKEFTWKTIAEGWKVQIEHPHITSP